MESYVFNVDVELSFFSLFYHIIGQVRKMVLWYIILIDLMSLSIQKCMDNYTRIKDTSITMNDNKAKYRKHIQLMRNQNEWYNNWCDVVLNERS